MVFNHLLLLRSDTLISIPDPSLPAFAVAVDALGVGVTLGALVNFTETSSELHVADAIEPVAVLLARPTVQTGVRVAHGSLRSCGRTLLIALGSSESGRTVALVRISDGDARSSVAAGVRRARVGRPTAFTL